MNREVGRYSSIILGRIQIRTLPVGRYSPPELRPAERISIRDVADLFTICTSHVERNNLTIRTFLRRFTRLTVGFSKKLENLTAAVAMHIANYNFVWRLREKGTSGKRLPTPSHASGPRGSAVDVRGFV